MIASGPRPVAPFSHAVEADGWIFITGQMPTDPEKPDAPLPAGIEAQTRRVMDNLTLVLAGIGLALENVTMARLYLTDFYRDYAPVNLVYSGYFPPGSLPARTCVGVSGLAPRPRRDRSDRTAASRRSIRASRAMCRRWGAQNSVEVFGPRKTSGHEHLIIAPLYRPICLASAMDWRKSAPPSAG